MPRRAGGEPQQDCLVHLDHNQTGRWSNIFIFFQESDEDEDEEEEDDEEGGDRTGLQTPGVEAGLATPSGMSSVGGLGLETPGKHNRY